MATKTEITISNYRLIKDLKLVFETGNLYFINAKNKRGKTSIINLIQDMFEAKSSTDNTVSFGEEQGETKMKIINFKNEEGNNYVLKYEYGATNKFSLLMPDGSVKKKVTDIRDVFKYQRMTVDKFFQLGLTADGRKEQSRFIKNLIPIEVRNRIEEIDRIVNERNGVLFLDRKTLNADLKSNQNVLANLQLTENEIKALKIKDEYNAKTILVKEEFQKLHDKKLSSNTDAIVAQKEVIETAIEEGKNTISDNEKRILELEAQILSLRDFNKKIVSTIENHEKTLVVLNKSINESGFSDNDEKRYAELKESVSVREDNEKKLEALGIKYANLLSQQKVVEELVEAVEEINNNIDELRAEKLSLLSSAKLPEKLVIVDDELFYDENGKYIPLDEDNTSYATGGKEIIKLIAQVNSDLPIVVIGKAAEYDEQSLEELAAIAKEYDKILVCDYVSTNEDIEITCYQKGEMTDE